MLKYVALFKAVKYKIFKIFYTFNLKQDNFFEDILHLNY
jgi:hypothetical protein